MSLKLIDKELRSKYAEALYKNEASYDKEIDRRFKRLNLDYTRNSHMVDAGSQIFLNKVRQKRSKWIQDDLKYRDYYRLVCRNVHNRKLENLKNYYSKNYEPLNVNKLEPVTKLRFNLLQEQLKQKEMNLTFFNSEPNLSKPRKSRKSVLPKIQTVQSLDIENYGNNDVLETETDDLEHRASLMTRLPSLSDKNNLKVGNDFEELYSRYTKSDREFIEKFPAKVELTVTDVGRQYIINEKRKHITIKRNIQNFHRTQENALTDQRYKNLVSYLVSD